MKLICRVSNEQRAAVMGSPFDYPLSSRLDENDAIFVMDDVLVPWENVFVYADIDKANNFFPRTGFLPRALLHGCTRLAVKLDFIIGLFIKATEMTGSRGFRGVEANLGEVIAWRNAMWGLSDAMARTADPWTGGCVLPGMEPASAYQVLAPEAYVQIKTLIEKTVASGLIYLNSHARDFKTPELRKYLDLYVRGSGGVTAVERVKLMKLLWDAVGSEFGARHELYEVNYSGSHEEIRRYALFGAIASGQYDRWKGFAETCMAEYDLDGWTTPDLINPDDVAVIRQPSSRHAGNHPDSLAKAAGEIVDPVAIPLPLARPGPRRTSIRPGVVSRLWLQHAPQRVSRTARHAAERMARRAGPGAIDCASIWKAVPRERRHRRISVPIPTAKCGACCIGSRGGNCCVWIRPRASPGGIIAMSWCRPRTRRQHRHRRDLHGAWPGHRSSTVIPLYLAAARRRPRAWSAGADGCKFLDSVEHHAE